MTSASSHPAQAVAAHPVGLRVCAALVGAAIGVLLALTLPRVVGGLDVDLATVSALVFAGIFLGGVAGLVGALRMINVPTALGADLAAAVFALTFLAVPFLLYVLAVAVFLAALSSYQF